MIDFSIPPELETTRNRVSAFMEEYVYPNESKMIEDEGLPVDLETELQKEVKARGLWAPNLPRGKAICKDGEFPSNAARR